MIVLVCGRQLFRFEIEQRNKKCLVSKNQENCKERKKPTAENETQSKNSVVGDTRIPKNNTKSTETRKTFNIHIYFVLLGRQIQLQLFAQSRQKSKSFFILSLSLNIVFHRDFKRVSCACFHEIPCACVCNIFFFVGSTSMSPSSMRNQILMDLNKIK